MSVFVTGDTHTPIDIGKLNTKRWPEQRDLSRDDYLIICGDFGAVWNGGPEDLYWQKWLNDKPFTTLFIDGNHENHRLLNDYQVAAWNGGKVHRVQQNVIHLMRGQVYNICGLKIFTMGGARSTDTVYRKEGVSWWPEELPSDAEYEEAQRNLDAAGWEVDLVLTHCAPNRLQNKLVPGYKLDKLTGFLDVMIYQCLEYSHWFFGHYHVDRQLDSYHTAIYNKIVKV